MQLGRIHQLRNALESEEISYSELAEITEAFDSLLESGVDFDEIELASDMLDALEDHVTTVEKVIYNWVVENFDENEANDPSWDIASLANEINQIPVIHGAEDSKLGHLLGEM